MNKMGVHLDTQTEVPDQDASQARPEGSNAQDQGQVASGNEKLPTEEKAARGLAEMKGG